MRSHQWYVHLAMLLELHQHVLLSLQQEIVWADQEILPNNHLWSINV